MIAIPMGSAWRITAFVHRYQDRRCSERLGPAEPQKIRRSNGRTSKESSRLSSSTIAAGVTVIAAAAASTTTAVPA